MTDYRQRMQARGIPTKPLLIDYRRGKRLYWAPARYVTIGARTMGEPGRRWTLRELARATGYTISGLRKALARLAQWGAIRVSSTRGWQGFTRILWAGDVSVGHERDRANVSTTVPDSLKRVRSTTSVRDTLTPSSTERPPGGGLESARAACARLAASLA